MCDAASLCHADKWQSDPFKLTEFDHPTDGPSLRGRGAADDKGGLLVALHGLAAVATAAGQGGARFPVNIRVMLEGQEARARPTAAVAHTQPSSMLHILSVFFSYPFTPNCSL